MWKTRNKYKKQRAKEVGREKWERKSKKIKIKECIYQPFHTIRIQYKINFYRSLTGLNSEISFYTGCRTEVKKPRLLKYLYIGGKRIVGFKHLPITLVLREMQTTSFRIWTLITVSISNMITVTSRAFCYIITELFFI